MGNTSDGDALHMFTVHGGPNHVLVIGGPHPNEPAGHQTVLFVAELLATRPELRERWTVHLLASFDPDGARLNEPWYRTPYDLRRYDRYFNRPALRYQPEWTFPHRVGNVEFSRTLPESRAGQKFIDETPIRRTSSLHNTDSGGAYFLITENDERLAEDLIEIAERGGSGVNVAPLDRDGQKEIVPGVFLRATADETLSTASTPPTKGIQSTQYGAKRYGERGFVGLVAEFPAWKVSPDELTPDQQRDALNAARIRLDGDNERLGEALRTIRETSATERLRAAIQETLEVVGRISVQAAKMAKEFDSQDVKPEVFNEIHRQSYLVPMRAIGMLTRLLDEVGSTQLAEETGQLLDDRLSEYVRLFRPEPVLIKTLVRQQAEAILATMRRPDEADAVDHAPRATLLGRLARGRLFGITAATVLAGGVGGLLGRTSEAAASVVPAGVTLAAPTRAVPGEPTGLRVVDGDTLSELANATGT
ncbi:MAG: M14 family zinc carboxypeptidase, partial [Actinomycetes bacterium]